MSFGVLLGTVLYLLLRSDAPRWMVPAIAGLLFWSRQLEDLALPDLFYGALLSCLLLLLWRGRLMLAALTMFPLMVARESTLLTVACFLIAGGRRLRVREAVTAVLATGAGMLLVKRLTVDALPNGEHISPMFYMVAKMPWNFLKNVLGLNPWANVYPSCAAPRWQMTLHLGPLHAIGLCISRFSLSHLCDRVGPRQLRSLPLAALQIAPGVHRSGQWTGTRCDLPALLRPLWRRVVRSHPFARRIVPAPVLL